MPTPASNIPSAPPRSLPLHLHPTPAPRPPRPHTANHARSLAFVPSPEPLLVYDLVAPKIDPHALVPIRCERPKRSGAYRVDLTRQDNVSVVHNYGHGGSGWTLGFGTTARALALFEDAHGAEAHAHNDTLSVVGGGVLGLYSAYCLAERYGAERVRVIAENFNELASHKAGGLLAPISLQVPEDQKTLLVRDARESLVLWQKIAQGRVRDFVGCAREMPVFLGDKTDAGLDVYYDGLNDISHPKMGTLPRPQRVRVQFDTGAAHRMQRQANLFMDTQKMMARLTEALVSGGVNFERKHVSDLTDLDSRFVFNCTGLGARSLVKDEHVYPVHGHLLGLGSQPAPDKLEYMIYATNRAPEALLDDSRAQEACYFMPKQVAAAGFGVIGGTFEARALHEREHIRLLDDVRTRAVRFFYGD